jgi:hypothetical protein
MAVRLATRAQQSPLPRAGLPWLQQSLNKWQAMFPISVSYIGKTSKASIAPLAGHDFSWEVSRVTWDSRAGEFLSLATSSFILSFPCMFRFFWTLLDIFATACNFLFVTSCHLVTFSFCHTLPHIVACRHTWLFLVDKTLNIFAVS